jgi:hypothetical protein
LPSQPETFEMRAMATTSAPAFLPTMSSSSMGSYASTELMNNTNSPDRAITTTTSPSTQKRCPTCGKRFSSVANRNKHIRFDCKYASTERFPCRNAGCRRGSERPFTRESYRNEHEQKYCRAPRRMSEHRKIPHLSP